MIFSKKEILTAIKKEPLMAGTWVSVYHKNRQGACKVCAVGAVLRRRGIPNADIASVARRGLRAIEPSIFFHAEASGDLEQALSFGHYLVALSIKFERLSYRYNMREVKRRLCRFVEKEFPDQFEYEGI